MTLLAYPIEDETAFSQRYLLEGSSSWSDPTIIGRSVDETPLYQALPELEALHAMTGRVQATMRHPTPEVAIELAESVRQSLGLTVDSWATAVGTSKRRYEEWRRGDTIPLPKMMRLAETSAFLEGLRIADPWATIDLFEQQGQRVVEALSRRAYAEAISQFEQQRQQQALLAKMVLARPVSNVSPVFTVEDVAVVKSGVFARLLQKLETLVPQTHAAAEAWRVEASLDLEGAIQLYRDENTVTEEWTLLASFTDEQVDAFEAEAHGLLADVHARPRDWSAWLSEQRQVAARNVRSLELAPRSALPNVPVEARATVEDLGRLGISLRLEHRPEGV